MRKSNDIDWLLEDDPFDWIEEELRGKETSQRKRLLLREAEKKYLQEREHLRQGENRQNIPEDWFERKVEKMGENTVVIIPTIWLKKDLKDMTPGRLKRQCDDPGRYDH